MHHLHFQYVTEAPTGQTCARLFQLMDDLDPALRAALLRDAFLALNVYQESNALCYREFKKRYAKLAQLVPQENLLVYGMVCYVLGNVYSRSSQRLFRLIEQHREDADDDPQSSDSLATLREEEHQLRVAYRSFCELVVAGLLGDYSPIDFGNEWLFEENDSDDATEIQKSSDPAVSKELSDLEQLSQKLFPLEEEIKPCNPVVTTFLDQVAANFETSFLESPQSIAVRVADKAMSVSVGEYCGPSDGDSTCPLILRVYLRGIPIMDAKVLQRIGLRPTPKCWIACRLEFSVLPTELALLANWTSEWIRGQQTRDPNPPSIPILLSGENKFFEFSGDPAEQSPFVEAVAEDARSAFSVEGVDWLDVDYLWSKDAREAYNAWIEHHEDGQ